MKCETEVREINFKYMLLYVLRRWRKIISAGLVLAVLLGAFSCATALINIDAKKDEYNTANKLYMDELAYYEAQKKQYESQINSYEQFANEQNTYLNESILMNLDYKNVAQANVNVFFKTDDISGKTVIANSSEPIIYDPTDSYQNLFFNNVYYNTDWETIAKKYNVNAQYIEELVNFKNQKDVNILKVTVNHHKPEVAEEILDELVEAITEQKKIFNAENPNVTITVVKNTTKLVVDHDLLVKQNTAKENLIKTFEKVTTIKALNEGLVMPTLSANDVSYASLVKDFIIFAVIGMLLGIIVVAGGYFLIYFLSDTVHSEEEFNDTVKAQVLGFITAKSKHRFGKKIDSFIESFSNINSDITESQKEKILIYNIKNTVKTAKTILIIGNAPQETLDSVKSLISNALDNVNITVARCIVKNADAYDEIKKNDVIIAVERIGCSKYTEISNTENLVKPKEIAGYILA